MVKPEYEIVYGESRIVLNSDCSEADDDMTELEDTEVKAGHERFGIADMNPNPM